MYAGTWVSGIYCMLVPGSQVFIVCWYSTLQVYQRSNSQVRHIPPKMSDKFESQHSLSPTIWSDMRVDIKRFFFYISRGEYVKLFVIDAYL